MRHVTIQEVAEASQVSTSAVSRILRGHTAYSYGADTQKRVRQAAERLGYQAHPAARLLRQQEKTLIGLMVQLSVNPYSNRLIMAVRDEVRRRGYEPVLLEPGQLKPTANHPFLSAEMLAGVLSLDLSLEQELPDFYRWLKGKVHFLALYPVAVPDVEWVYTAHARGIEIAAEHLYELGHRRVAFPEVCASPYPSDYLKLEGWRKSVQKYGFDTDPQCTLPIYVGEPIEEMAARIVRGLELINPTPSALICPSDEVALCVIASLGSKGWKLPEELSIVGFDGIHFGAYSDPPLTTIEHPVAGIAQAGVARLLNLMKATDSPYPTPHQLIEPSLLMRGSTTHRDLQSSSNRPSCSPRV